MEALANSEPVATPELRLNPFSTLLGVLFRPRRTFNLMRTAERGYWWVVLILALIGLIFSTVVTVPIQVEASRAAFAAQREQMGDLSPEQEAQIEQSQQLFNSPILLSALGIGTGLVGLLINYLIRTALLYALGLVFGGRASFKQVFRMSVWTTLPEVIRTFVTAAAVAATGNMPAPGFSYMLSPDEMREASMVIVALLQSIDIYLIWSLVLIAVGVSATYQLSAGKSAIVSLIYWLVGLVFTLGLAAVSQSMASAFGPG